MESPRTTMRYLEMSRSYERSASRKPFELMDMSVWWPNTLNCPLAFGMCDQPRDESCAQKPEISAVLGAQSGRKILTRPSLRQAATINPKRNNPAFARTVIRQLPETRER